MSALALLLAVTAVTAEPPDLVPADDPGGKAECIDQELQDKLAIKRRRRGKAPRDFVKAQRHEISIGGGWWVSDLFAGAPVVGGAYTYHMTEDAAVEASVAVTKNDAETIRAIEGGRGEVVGDVSAQTRLVASSLLWYPLHGKLRAGGAIVHFDIHLDLGVGVIDAPTSRGAAGLAGVGVKLFASRAVAVRLDVRDHVYRQELLDERFLVNDVAVTLGLSLFLPLGF